MLAQSLVFDLLQEIRCSYDSSTLRRLYVKTMTQLYMALSKTPTPRLCLDDLLEILFSGLKDKVGHDIV